MAIGILGIGMVSALGCGVDSLRQGLEGTRAPRIETQPVDTPDGPMPFPAYRAQVSGLERFMSPRALRRLDRFARMALLASHLALEDSGVAVTDPARVGIVFGSAHGPLRTTFAFQDSVIESGDKCASPTHFAGSVHNALAAQVSMALQIQGPSLTTTCFEQTAGSALLAAQLWLEQGTADYVLVGGGEELCDVRSYAEAMLGAGRAEAILPFAYDRCSYAPGEGFVAFLLGERAAAGGYCSLRRVLSGRPAGALARYLCARGESRRIGSPQAFFLAANGDRRTGEIYRLVAPAGARLAAYSPLYGGMASGSLFDVAIAAMSLRHRRWYATPRPEGGEALSLLRAGEAMQGSVAVEGSSPESYAIGCVQFSPDGVGDLVVVSE